MGNGGGMAFVAAVLALTFAVAPAGAAGLGFEFHHRFSDRVRQWAEERNLPGTWWPEKGTAEYYAALVHHDLAHVNRGRLLADGASTFVNGNTTYYLSSLGYLHYAFVTVGTPKMTFLVALDTGSDLFWLPCDCIKCAPATSENYPPGINSDHYSPSNSSTSKKVPCSDGLCELQTSCAGVTSSCPYVINYLDGSSTTGVLVEDVLYLTTEGSTHHVVQAPVLLGCGSIQSGTLLDSGAVHGLLGLGRDNISVPSILASKGLISDAFSMCFGDDGIGRINFGDKGSSDQMETPLVLTDIGFYYTIGITTVRVGHDTMATSFSIVVDSGTSFTLLTDPLYSRVTKSFNSQVQEKRYVNDPGFLFEFCYNLSPTQTSILVPKITLTAKGGSTVEIDNPIMQIQNIYCLAIINSSENILGQNFLTGLRVVFDRERSIFGWKKFDCYRVESKDNQFNTSGQQNSSVIPVGSKSMSSVTDLSVLSVLLLILSAISWLYLQD